MDYLELYHRLPKHHILWSIQDTKVWLSYIGLDNLAYQFQQSSIDGSILGSLTEDDFKNQLNIQSKVVLKKLMNWIRNGLPQFDIYAQRQNNLNLFQPIKSQTYLSKPHPSQSNQTFKFIETSDNRKRDGTSLEKKNREENQLIIKQCDISQAATFSLKNKGGLIGRHTSNEIIVLDEYVSRHHAEIIFNEEEYYIRDCGSNSGTFLKVAEKLPVSHGCILELGSNQLEISVDHANSISLTIIDGPDVGQVFAFPGLTKISLGRKQSNQMNFPDDQHLSGIHSKLFKVDEIWYIEDMATTNGTWIRLSKEAQQSKLYLLEDQAQFKISSNLIYECRRNKGNRKTHKFKDDKDKCQFCCKNDKNVILMPCKHSVGCFECMSNLQVEKCSICDSKVEDVIKIFTV